MDPCSDSFYLFFQMDPYGDIFIYSLKNKTYSSRRLTLAVIVLFIH